MLCLSYYCIYLLFNKIEGQNRFCLEIRGIGGERERIGGRGEK
jgi:hypothetical protein